MTVGSMKSRSATVLLSMFASLAGFAPAFAQGTVDEQSGGFMHRRSEGWFWYRVEPVEPDAVEEDVPVSAEAPAPESEPVPDPGPTPLSSAWLKQNLPRYREIAIDDPSPANIQNYKMLERIALDKATRFAQASKAVTIGDPVLDATAERPLATYAVHAVDAAAKAGQVDVVGQIGETTGLLFFFQGDCPVCEAQANVLERFANRHGFVVMPVSLDGAKLNGGQFAGAYRSDQGQAHSLGIKKGPAVFMMRPPNQFVPLGFGALDLEALEQRAVLLSKEMGWISETDWRRTVPSRQTTQVPEIGDIPTDVLADPQRLAAYLRRVITR